MDAFLAIFRTPSKIQKFTDAENTPPPSPENWECFEQSCVNRTESVHGTLSFLFLSHLQCMGYVWISSLWIGTFQRAAPRPIIQLTDNIQSGGSFSVSYYQCTVCVYSLEENKGNWAKWIIRKESVSEDACLPFIFVPINTHHNTWSTQ